MILPEYKALPLKPGKRASASPGRTGGSSVQGTFTPDKEQEIRSKVKNKDDKNEDTQRFQARLLILNTQEENAKEIELSPISYIPRFQTIA